MSTEVNQFLVSRLDAFQSLISKSLNNLSKIKFNQTLLESAKKLSFSHAASSVGIEGPLTSVKQLKSLASSLKHDRRHNLFTVDEQFAMNQHLSRLEYLLELKSFFHDRIFSFIWKITSQWQSIVENMQKSEMAERKSVEDDITKVNDCSLTEEDVKEITEFVNRINDIESRWTKMTDCSELDLTLFEDETKEVILTPEKSPLQLICYMIPDMTKKIEKCVELSKKWLKVVSQKQIHQNISTGIESRRKIIEASKKILQIGESIREDEKRARRLQTELKRLANKEVRYVVLKDDYETTAEKLEQVCSDYRNAVLERHSLNRRILKEPGFSETNERKKLDEVGNRIEASHKDMKMLKYSFALLQEDMALEASMRSSYIRFEENVKSRLSKLEMQIAEKKQKKKKVEKELILLKANSKLFESKYEEEDAEKSFEEVVKEFQEKRNHEKPSSENIYLWVSVENEPGVTPCNEKLVETDKNSTVSRIPILRNYTDFPKPSQSTNVRLKLLPVAQNSNHREKSRNQKNTRIPKRIQ